MNTHIRPITHQDATRFFALRARALQEHPEAFAQSHRSHMETPLEAVEERLRSTAESPDEFILGLFDGDEALIGMVGFSRYAADKTRHKGLIWGMYVASEAQGRGFGRALMQEAISRAQAMPGLEQINLAVIDGNTSARRLYLSLGFRTYGLEKRAVIVNGEYLDDEYMALRLNG